MIYFIDFVEIKIIGKEKMPKSLSNMYEWITDSWNPIGGICPHNCAYCYVRKFRWPSLKEKYSGSPKLIEHQFKKNLGKGKFWFVGSCFDLFAWTIPEEWIERTLIHCQKYPKNKYLFQSKNPQRFQKYYGKFPNEVIFGTTIESNRDYPEIYQQAPPIVERYCNLATCREDGGEVMVTIEPLLEFNLIKFVDMIHDIEPAWVNIGADSKGHKLPEPVPEKVILLINELKTFTEVKIKKNLKRLMI